MYCCSQITCNSNTSLLYCQSPLYLYSSIILWYSLSPHFLMYSLYNSTQICFFPTFRLFALFFSFNKSAKLASRSCALPEKFCAFAKQTRFPLIILILFHSLKTLLQSHLPHIINPFINIFNIIQRLIIFILTLLQRKCH